MAKKEKPPVEVKVTFTDGYEKRFTAAILKTFAAREKQKAAGDKGTRIA